VFHASICGGLEVVWEG